MNSNKQIRRTALTSALALVVCGSAAAAGIQAPKDAAVQAQAMQAQGLQARIIVRYHDNAAAASSLSGKTRLVNQAAARTGVASLRSAAMSHKRRMGIGAELFAVGGNPSHADLQALVAELQADPAVKYAVIDGMMRAIRPQMSAPLGAGIQAAAPNDQYYAGYQWHLRNTTGGIDVQSAWDYSRGDGVVVAVLDTGILPDHPDFAQTDLLPGYDFISSSYISRRPTNDRVPGALDYGDWSPVANECYAGSPASSSSWHGTHVAGTVAESTNNTIGMAGAAPNATVLPVRVLGRCGGANSDINDAITWASGGTVPGVPNNPNPAQVINMSLGGGGACDAAIQAAIDGAVSRGTVVVVAAGNSGMDAAGFTPASCNNVINVGASRSTGARASYSNYGASVDIAAPGGGGGADGNPGGYIWQAWNNGATTPTSGTYDYIGMTGTSMASPHVAAVAALVQAARVEADLVPYTPAQMETVLKDTARAFPVAIPETTPIGSGIVNPAAALAVAVADDQDPGEPGEPGEPQAIELVNKVAVHGASGGDLLYSFQAAAGSRLVIMTYAGTGNVSLYVKHGAEPTAADHDHASTRAGNSETVSITAPTAGTYYIKLSGTYGGVSVMARQ